MRFAESHRAGWGFRPARVPLKVRGSKMVVNHEFETEKALRHIQVECPGPDSEEGILPVRQSIYGETPVGLCWICNGEGA